MATAEDGKKGAGIEAQCARVDIFARRMKEKLRANARKGDWRETMQGPAGPMLMLSRAWGELEEMDAAVGDPDRDADRVLDEAADVANFAMMAADLVRPLESS